jgi:hypothetical protein
MGNVRGGLLPPSSAFGPLHQPLARSASSAQLLLSRCEPRNGPAQPAEAALPSPLSVSLADVWGPPVSGVFLLLLVTEVDTPVESDATPSTSWLDPHVELPLK